MAINRVLNLNLTYEALNTGIRSDSNIGKTQLVLFDKSNNFCAISVKMDRFVLEEKSSLKKLGLYFSF